VLYSHEEIVHSLVSIVHWVPVLPSPLIPVDRIDERSVLCLVVVDSQQ